MSRTWNFAQVAIVGYKDDTGIGRQCHNMRSVLGLGCHLVAPSRRLSGHALDPQSERQLFTNASLCDLKILLHDLSGVIVMERNKWNPALFEAVKKLGKTLILLPNWEWFDAKDIAYQLVDLFVVHSRHALLFLNSLGFQNAILLPPPIDTSLLPLRNIKSRPLCFVHNAGIIDASDRKGTLFVLKAWAMKKPSQARLIVRYQRSELPFPESGFSGNIAVSVGSAPMPGELYTFGHCAIQPSRLEGLGYMVLEPIICGIPTITTDAPPMNEWPAGTVLCKASPSSEHSVPRRRGCGSAPLYDVDVFSLARTIEHLEASDLSDLSGQALEFRREHAPTKVRAQWQAALQQL